MFFDVWFEILSFLEVKEVMQINTTSKIFYEITKKPQFWKQSMSKFLTKKKNFFSNKTEEPEINWKEEFKKRKFNFKSKKSKIFESKIIQSFVPDQIYLVDKNPSYCVIKQKELINDDEKTYLLDKDLVAIDMTNEDTLLFELICFEFNEEIYLFEKSKNFKPYIHKELIDFIEKRYLSLESLKYVSKILNLFFHFGMNIESMSFNPLTKNKIYLETRKKFSVESKYDESTFNMEFESQIKFDFDQKIHWKEEKGLFECKLFGLEISPKKKFFDYVVLFLSVNKKSFEYTKSSISKFQI